jgi:peptidoglycan/xylan/chitin deacetylase (PgdA/CDA1 family)
VPTALDAVRARGHSGGMYRRLAARVAAMLALLGAAAAVAAIVTGAPVLGRVAPAKPHATGRVRRRLHGVVARNQLARKAHSAGAAVATVHGAAARRAVVPILMYHVIGRPPAGAPFRQLWVSPGHFAAQLRALAARGYHPVTLRQAFAAWRHGAPLPRRPVVLSFDDGYRTDATVAARLLRRRGWPAVLDLAIRNAGRGGIPVHDLHRLVRDGWEIDSHTVDHADLTTVGPHRLRSELVRSKAWIHRVLGVRARFFCYPAGRFDPGVEAAVRAAGYDGATTELPGAATAASNRFALPRVRAVDGPLPALG